MTTDDPASIQIPGGEPFPYNGNELYVVMPQIRFVSYAAGDSAAARPNDYPARARRRFMITEDWEIGIRHKLLDGTELVGRISIPKATKYVFDGASIPAHALVSMLSGGVLRPLGVAFIPSLVHDYAYAYGGIRLNGAFTPLSRDDADALFRDMFYAVYRRRPSFWGWVAWAAVRLGRFIGVKYADGKTPDAAP